MTIDMALGKSIFIEYIENIVKKCFHALIMPGPCSATGQKDRGPTALSYFILF